MSARDELLASWRIQLDEARSIGRARSLRIHDGVDFSSNDYLGFARGFDEVDSVRLTGSTGSRSLSGHSEAYERLERSLADWHRGSDAGEPVAALCFASGYAANEGLLSTILGPDDLVCSDEWNHGSLIDGIRLSKADRLIFPHQDLGLLEEAVQPRIERVRSRGGRIFVVTESLFGMDGDRTDLVALADLCDRVDALLVVDEAHATGCFGANGEGLIGALGLRDRVFASVHTCGKALGSHGAYVVGPPTLRDLLIQGCRQFIFSTALPDAVIERTARAVERCRSTDVERTRLAGNSARLRQALKERDVPVSSDAGDHILPVVLGSDAAVARVSAKLLELGLRVPAIRYPTVAEDRARLRISVRADHSEDALDRLAELLRECRGECA